MFPHVLVRSPVAQILAEEVGEFQAPVHSADCVEAVLNLKSQSLRSGEVQRH